jgi:hypothetical protein
MDVLCDRWRAVNPLLIPFGVHVRLMELLHQLNNTMCEHLGGTDLIFGDIQDTERLIRRLPNDEAEPFLQILTQLVQERERHG